MKQTVLEMLKRGHAEAALDELSKTNNNASLVLADYRNERKLRNDGFITEQEFQDYEKDILGRIANLPNEIDENGRPPFEEKASVFLSYNRSDLDTAVSIVEELRNHSIRVRMDQTDVEPGQAISEFIVEQIRNSTAVMLLVSAHSLKSGWVSNEIVLAMSDEKLNNKRIIPVSIDKCCFDDQYDIDAFKEIDAKIEKTNQEIQYLNEMKAGTIHRHDDLQRLIEMRHYLPTLLMKLRNVNVEDISGQRLKPVMQKIAVALVKRI